MNVILMTSFANQQQTVITNAETKRIAVELGADIITRATFSDADSLRFLINENHPSEVTVLIPHRSFIICELPFGNRYDTKGMLKQTTAVFVS